MSRAPRVVYRAACGLLAVGVVCLGYAAYVAIGVQAYQAAEHRRFEQARTNEAPPPPLTDGGVIGEIQIPRLRLKAMIVQGDSPAILRRAVGHLSNTALPGEAGNVALAGHRDTFFRPLSRVREGDAITLNTRDGQFTYLVESIAVVKPSAIEVLQPTRGRTLTLITCFPFSYLGSAPDRFIVRARETDGSR